MGMHALHTEEDVRYVVVLHIVRVIQTGDVAYCRMKTRVGKYSRKCLLFSWSQMKVPLSQVLLFETDECVGSSGKYIVWS